MVAPLPTLTTREIPTTNYQMIEVMELYIYEYHRPKMAEGDEIDVGGILASRQSYLFRLGQLLCLKTLWRLLALPSLQEQSRLFVPSLGFDLCFAEVTGLAHTLLPFEGHLMDSVAISGRPCDLFPNRDT